MKRKRLPLSDDDTVNEKSDAQEQAENKKSARYMGGNNADSGACAVRDLACFGRRGVCLYHSKQRTRRDARRDGARDRGFGGGMRGGGDSARAVERR